MKLKYRLLVWWWQWSPDQRGWIIGLSVTYLILLGFMLWFAWETKHLRSQSFPVYIVTKAGTP